MDSGNRYKTRNFNVMRDASNAPRGQREREILVWLVIFAFHQETSLQNKRLSKIDAVQLDSSVCSTRITLANNDPGHHVTIKAKLILRKHRRPEK